MVGLSWLPEFQNLVGKLERWTVFLIRSTARMWSSVRKTRIAESNRQQERQNGVGADIKGRTGGRLSRGMTVVEYTGGMTGAFSLWSVPQKAIGCVVSSGAFSLDNS
jgi:hypothetical protein